MHRSTLRACASAALALCAAASASAASTPIEILFVGDSYTFGRVDPVMSYNAANVHDLTAGFDAVDSSGTNAFEPHPWGGVPGIFKEFTTESGLNYDVSISARNAASLRGQFLDSASSAWKLRENVASKTWNVVVLQDQSDVSLPNGKGKNADNAQFQAYVNQFVNFIHTGTAQTYTETQLYGSLANCEAAGDSKTSCGIKRVIPANTNASANTKVYLTETWARPDMVFAHQNTVPDPNSPSGEPIVDTSSTGGPATLYYTSLGAMTFDLHAAFAAEAAANPGIAGVIPVGDAFQLAVNQGSVQSSGFYDANGVGGMKTPSSSRRRRASRSTCGGTTTCTRASTARTSTRWCSTAPSPDSIRCCSAPTNPRRSRWASPAPTRSSSSAWRPRTWACRSRRCPSRATSR
jgi:hypothetical protein